jgi:hypothetical protein
MVERAELPKEKLEQMYDAAETAVECQRVLQNTGHNVVSELLRHQPSFVEWDHYPKGDVYDQRTCSQYYYHAHAADQRAKGEHGHFHLFIRPGTLGLGVRPVRLADYKAPATPNDEVCHLIGVSMDKFGQVMRLFTTNRWVTGETWFAADDVIRLLDHFKMDHAQPSWPVNLWLNSIVTVFKPIICTLIAERDNTIACRISLLKKTFVYEDRGLEVTSQAFVRLPDQIAAIEQVLYPNGLDAAAS